jgi:hypothetical protein
LPFTPLTTTPGDRAGGSDFGFDRREGSAFVRAIAKRLRFGLSTGAPKIGAGLNFLDVRLFLGNGWFAHAHFVAACRSGGNNLF